MQVPSNLVRYILKSSHYTQETIVNLRRQTVDAVVGEVQSSYSHVLPGLPYSELPVISLTSTQHATSEL